MKRAVITGIGAVCPLSCNIKEAWEQLVDGESGIRKIETFDTSDLASKIAGQLPTPEHPKNATSVMIPTDWVSGKDVNRVDPFIVYAMAAATQAISDAGVDSLSEEEKDRAGVIIASGIGGLNTIYETSLTLNERGARRVSPFFIPSALINLASGHVSMRYGFRGPNHAVVTACSSGTHAIGDAAKMVQLGEADIMVAGGAEAAVCRLGIAGFSAARSLSSKFNDAPEEASRPWDKQRDGFIISEGAACVIVEEYEHAKARGAQIYAELIGYGMSGDAHHITAPPADGNGGYRAMTMAMNKANVNPEDIDYINAHGTSTAVGDLAELRAVESIFTRGTHVSMSSTKSATGHLLGAAGALEAIICMLAIKHNIVPPTLNLHDPEDTWIDLTPLTAKERRIDIVMSNSFGFGGTNSSIILKRV